MDLPDLTVGGRRAMMTAKRLAADYKHDFITTEHVLLAILDSDKMTRGLKSISKDYVDLSQFKSFVISSLMKYKGPDDIDVTQIEPSARTLTMLSYASSIASEMGASLIDVDHILLSILVSDSGSGNNLFRLKNINVDELYDVIYSAIQPKQTRKKKNQKQKTNTGYSSNVNDQDVEFTENIIDKYASNLTELAFAGEIDPVIGRDHEVREMIQILSRRTKNNPVLVGEPGVGKTAVVELLAHRIVNGDVPQNLRNKQIYTLDLTQLVAGTIYRGQFEERLKEVVNYATQTPNLIIFIDELHMLVGAGSSTGSMDASNILKPALARGKISCIGATTTNEYKEFIEGDGALERRFQEITVGEPQPNDVIEILRGIKEKYEDYHNVKYNKSVITEIVNLCDRYIVDKNFPDKAIDILDESGAVAKVSRYQGNNEIKVLVDELQDVSELKERAVEREEYDLGLGYRETENELINKLEQALEEREATELSTNVKPARISVENIRELISSKCGVPVSSMEADELKILTNLSKNMKTRVIGQNDGIDRICNAIKRSRAGVSNPDKPICSLLFLGPTGVGKTYLAHELGREMFHDGNFKQYDMSEFSERHSTSKLIGSPPGYVGYGEGGSLTEYVRHNPYCVLLFDEIEKAHPEVLQLFLQVFEYGCLTDSEGLEVNFKNTIIVLTSNIGAHKFEKGPSIGFGPGESIEEGVVAELKKMYAPEFINRLDEVVVFNKLTDKDIMSICNILIKGVKRTLKKNNGKIVVFDNNIPGLLLSKSRDSAYGARPLKRIITEFIETPLAEYIISNDPNIKKIHASVKDDQVIFSLSAPV